jgi:hypothetical protein
VLPKAAVAPDAMLYEDAVRPRLLRQSAVPLEVKVAFKDADESHNPAWATGLSQRAA